MEEWRRAGTKFMMAANMHKTRNDKIRHLIPFHFNGAKLIRKVPCHCKCQALLSQETYGDTLRPKQLVWLHFRQNEKHPHPRRKLKKGSGIVLRQTPWCHSHWKRRVCPCILGGVWIFIMRSAGQPFRACPVCPRLPHTRDFAETLPELIAPLEECPLVAK